MVEATAHEGAPAGYRPGDVPQGVEWPASLWLILPAKPTSSQNECIAETRRQLTKWSEIRISDVRLKNTRGYDGQIFPLVPAKDLFGLYRSAHRFRVAVITFGAARVLLDISEEPTNRGCVSLDKFLQYKCAHSLVTRPAEVEQALTTVRAWISAVNCEGPHDPRCLPRAIFQALHPYPLDNPKERQTFLDAHKVSRNSGLMDAQSRTWTVGPYHTRDLIQVAGRTLPIGFHWDVKAVRDTIIVTGWDRWKLPGRGYTNIHPDALVRGGKATRTHALPSDEVVAKPPRTPRSARQMRKGK